MKWIGKRFENPSRWFAWYPVRLRGENATVWLEYVRRYWIEGADTSCTPADSTGLPNNSRGGHTHLRDIFSAHEYGNCGECDAWHTKVIVEANAALDAKNMEGVVSNDDGKLSSSTAVKSASAAKDDNLAPSAQNDSPDSVTGNKAVGAASADTKPAPAHGTELPNNSRGCHATIEKVARAIAAVFADHDVQPDYDMTNNNGRFTYDEAAQAAIAAIPSLSFDEAVERIHKQFHTDHEWLCTCRAVLAALTANGPVLIKGE